MLDGRQVSGTGGLLDFVRGARLSKVAGRSWRSFDRKRQASRIVPRLGETDIVSCPRADADILVTEHGIARLRDNWSTTRRALIAIADPRCRDELAGAWTAIPRRARPSR